MVALSGVSMNNLESFAAENFSAGLVLSFHDPSRALPLCARAIVERRENATKKGTDGSYSGENRKSERRRTIPKWRRFVVSLKKK